MLTLEDCLDYIGLTEEEVAEVAHHDHLPMMCAIEECSQLLEGKDGIHKIQEIILDNIVEAHELNMEYIEKYRIQIYGKFINKHIEEL